MAAPTALEMRCCRPDFGRGDDDHAGVALAHLDIGARGAHERIADLLHHPAQVRERGVGFLRLGEAHLHHGVVGDADAGKADLRFAQAPVRVVAQRLQPVLADVRHLHGEQQVRAAAQVQAQIELRFGQPVGQLRQRVLGEEVGQHHQQPDQAGEQDHGLLPG